MVYNKGFGLELSEQRNEFIVSKTKATLLKN